MSISTVVFVTICSWPPRSCMLICVELGLKPLAVHRTECVPGQTLMFSLGNAVCPSIAIDTLLTSPG